MNKHLVWLLAAPLLSGCDDLTGLGNCSNDRDFSDVISASGIATLRVQADRGDLQIIGRPGLNQVRVYATACASDNRTVSDVDFDLFYNGNTIELETYVPQRDNAHINLVVEVPEEMAADIYHDDGDIEIRDIDLVFIDDESGHINVRNIFFNVEIRDGSGDINIFNVDGSVDIDDGSGDIDVEDVGGDLLVRYDASGSIRHRNIRGFIDLP
jgi:hypothetical protein